MEPIFAYALLRIKLVTLSPLSSIIDGVDRNADPPR